MLDIRAGSTSHSVSLTHVARSAAQDALNTIFKLTFTGQRKAAYGEAALSSADTFHRRPRISTKQLGSPSQAGPPPPSTETTT